MITAIGDNIFNSCGFGTRAVYKTVCMGVRGTVNGSLFPLCEPVCASVISRDTLGRMAAERIRRPERYTPLEQALILSVQDAVQQAGIDPAAPTTGLVLSSTKGNISLLEDPDPAFGPERIHLWSTARMVADYFGNPNTPTIASNACISGASAQIAAFRLLEGGRFRHVIVTGGDLLSRFIVSGFQSFKALSPRPCRPFDGEREGLNLGEAAGTIVYTRTDTPTARSVSLCTGASCNDANHISGPSRTGEGSFQCLQQLLRRVSSDDIAFINAHGTATRYNDDMESIAIHRAGLSDVPVFSLKHLFGHTLGAAGIIESILSMHTLRDGMVLPSFGCDHCGTAEPLRLESQPTHTQKKHCIKMLSGFGGSNAALLFHLNN